jgi:hypothetical protein
MGSWYALLRGHPEGRKAGRDYLQVGPGVLTTLGRPGVRSLQPKNRLETFGGQLAAGVTKERQPVRWSFGHTQTQPGNHFPAGSADPGPRGVAMADRLPEGASGHGRDHTDRDDRSVGGGTESDPAATDHPTGEEQAEENTANEPAG